MSHTPTHESIGTATPQQFGLVKAAYSIRETAAVLSIGRSTVYELIGHGELVAIKRGKSTRILACDLAELLAKWKAKSAR